LHRSWIKFAVTGFAELRGKNRGRKHPKKEKEKYFSNPKKKN
jgi:hypothetical protein